MFSLEKFGVQHVYELAKEPSNEFLNSWITSGHAVDLANNTHSYAGIVGGEVLVVGGVVEQWANRAFLWTVFSEKSKRHFVSVFRGIKKFLDEQPFRRIEMSVPLGCEVGTRRALMLGFKMETPRAEAFLPNGEDCAIFTRIKKVEQHG